MAAIVVCLIVVAFLWESGKILLPIFLICFLLALLFA